MGKLRRPHAPILRFLGGAGTVSGSRFLLETREARVLIDCGLFQGLKDLRLRNWERFPVDPETIDAVVLTHAHLDHCGYLPALFKFGFRGRVLSTPGTYELCKVILADSAFIQERDAEYANKHGYSKHEPALPLYTREHAAGVLELFETAPYHQPRAIASGVEIEFHFAGHILGSSIVSVEIDSATAGHKNTRLGFSGDLGRYIPVRAEIANLTALSVHADRDELVAWAGSAARKPDISFVVHGEPEASEALREALETRLDFPAVVPKQQERIRFD